MSTVQQAESAGGEGSGGRGRTPGATELAHRLRALRELATWQ